MRHITTLAFAIFCGGIISAQCYTVTPATYAPDTSFQSVGVIVPVTDDHWSDVIPIGFTFCFYGNQYDSVIVGDNGLVSFEIQWALSYCLWPISSAIPSPSLTSSHNAIGVPYQDLYIMPNPQQHIYYWTSGSAPNRTFTVLYDSIPMYSCTSTYYTGRVILYEGGNNIEVQVDHKDLCSGWNGGNGILGISNQAGTDALAAPGRNYPNTWTASQEAWLFTPTCNVCAGVGMDENENAELRVFPNPVEKNSAVAISFGNVAVARYEVVDVAGRIVYSETPITNQIQFMLNESGLYFVRMYTENGELLSNEKLIVR